MFNATKPLPPGLLELRGRVRHLIRGTSDATLGKILRIARGDVDLAATAIEMNPRPRWVEEIVGEHPIPPSMPVP